VTGYEQGYEQGYERARRQYEFRLVGHFIDGVAKGIADEKVRAAERVAAAYALAWATSQDAPEQSVAVAAARGDGADKVATDRQDADLSNSHDEAALVDKPFGYEQQPDDYLIDGGAA